MGVEETFYCSFYEFIIVVVVVVVGFHVLCSFGHLVPVRRDQVEVGSRPVLDLPVIHPYPQLT